MSSSERFGYEWGKYNYLLPQYEQQFLKWIHPLTAEFFKDKTILDAGCGMGRNSYWCLQYGAKKVVAFDLDERSLAAAHQNLKVFATAEVVRGDIYSFDYPKTFDLVFSIGVIHHLERPADALRNLLRLVKPGGTMLIWVYGREGNGPWLAVIDPIRRFITSRLPLSIVHLLAYAISLPLYTFLHIFPQRRPYLAQLKGFSFAHIHSIIFDQLIPGVAYYWTKDDALQLLKQFSELTDVRILPVNGISWTVTAVKRDFALSDEKL